MILGSKSLMDMDDNELRAAVEELRGQREALLADAKAKKARGEAVEKIKKQARAPREAKPVDDIMKEFLA